MSIPKIKKELYKLEKEQVIELIILLYNKYSDVKDYLNCVDKVFYLIAKYIKTKNPEKYLKGPVCHSGFKRLA